MKNKVPGFPGMNVPGPNELRPHMQDSEPERGPLAFIGTGVQMVHDYGAPAAPIGTLYPTWDRPTLSGTSSAPEVDTEEAETAATPNPRTKKSKR